MKIKVVANYDTDLNIYKSVINCFGKNNKYELTLDETEAEYLVVINGYPTSKIKHSRDKIIGVLQEPEGNNNYDRNLSFYCSKIACQSEEMFRRYGGVIEGPVSMFYSHHVTTDKNYFESFNNFNNRKKLCIIVSSISTPNNPSWKNHNYTKRHKLINALLKTDMDFDFYGRGWNIGDSRYKGQTLNKHETLRQYEYSIAIENCCEKNYASEKIFDCFLNNTVPIYYGCPNVSEFYDVQSYETVDIESPQAIQDIARIITDSNQKYQEAIQRSKKRYFEENSLYSLLEKTI